METERRDRRAKEEVMAGEGDATVARGDASGERPGLAATKRERESGRGNGEAATAMSRDHVA
jgi:hypothetical protein